MNVFLSANKYLAAPIALARTWNELQAAEIRWKGQAKILAGYIGYDAAHEIENLEPPATASPLPALQFGVFEAPFQKAPDPDLRGHVSAGKFSASPGFEEAVERIIGRIRRGDFFQTNLCRYLDASFDPACAWPLFCRLPRQEHSAFLDLGEGRTILSMSPETFLRVDASGRVESLPIKGTRPLATDPRELLGSAKDRAELAMVVDVARNDLSRVCIPGSVQVVEHAALMTLPTLHHTYSRVVGQLRDGVSLVDLIRATFPPASITGAPKIEAIKAAQAEEGRSRGPCMGAIGYLDLATGTMELSVAIRTAYTANSKVTYLAGCGITADSDPAAELRESEAKAAAFLAAFRPA